MKLDVSALVRAGPVPLSRVFFGASSLAPLSRPLFGSRDRLVPQPLANLPDSELFVGGFTLVPRGALFEQPLPGALLHYSNFGRSRGYSGTLGLVAKPDPREIGSGDWRKFIPIYGYLDLKYVKRVSDSVDLGLSVGYTYSLPSDPGEAPATK